MFVTPAASHPWTLARAAEAHGTEHFGRQWHNPDTQAPVLVLVQQTLSPCPDEVQF